MSTDRKTRKHPKRKPTLEPPQVTGVAPLLGEERSDERLRHARRGLRRRLVRALESLGKDGVAGRPAESRAGADGLGKGVDADDAALAVEVEVRRNETREELGVGFGLVRQSGGALLLRAVVLARLQEVVGCEGRSDEIQHDGPAGEKERAGTHGHPRR